MSNVPKLEDLPWVEYQDDFGATQRIYPDVDESEDVGLPAEVTTNPIEEGADVADNYRPQPDTVDLKWFISESPIRGDLGSIKGSRRPVKLIYPPAPPPAISLLTAVNAVQTLLGFGDAPPKTMNVLQFPSAPKRFAEVIASVQDIRLNKRLCRVKTSTTIFPDMMLTNANPTRSKAEGDGGRISLSFQHVEFVVSAEALAVPVEPRAVPQKTVGTQGTDTDAAGGPGKTLAAGLRDFLKGLGRH